MALVSVRLNASITWRCLMTGRNRGRRLFVLQYMRKEPITLKKLFRNATSCVLSGARSGLPAMRKIIRHVKLFNEF